MLDEELAKRRRGVGEVFLVQRLAPAVVRVPVIDDVVDEEDLALGEFILKGLKDAVS